MNLKSKARELRLKTLERTYLSRTGHIGGCLSCIDILTVLFYDNFLSLDPRDANWDLRDRFILSKGHCATPLYLILQDMGYDIADDYPGYADSKYPGIELTTGSLGHGLGVGVGMALASKLDKKYYKTVVLLGDGECYEGSVWESAMFAAHHNLGNLTVIIDRNRQCVTDFTEDCNELEPLAAKWGAFNWNVAKIDGHNIASIQSALKISETCTKPLMIIAETIKGKGISFMEKQIKWHHGVPSEEEYNNAVNELRN